MTDTFGLTGRSCVLHRAPEGAIHGWPAVESLAVVARSFGAVMIPIPLFRQRHHHLAQLAQRLFSPLRHRPGPHRVTGTPGGRTTPCPRLT